MSKLKIIKKKRSGRDSSGRISVRHKGGEHKRFLRNIDFKRDKLGVSGRVVSIEYDPNRTSDISLIQYTDGEKRYILRPEEINLNDVIKSGQDVEIRPGNTLPLASMPVGTAVHNIELTPGHGGQLARTAGSFATVLAKEGNYVNLKLPSGEMRRVRKECYATVGNLGNVNWKNEVIGKAGRKRNMGIRPTVRGVAQNPRSHAHGGGEGRSGIGMPTPKNYRGRKAVGKTRRKKKYSDKFILQRRKK
ncbi:MAG: 50S ribosomal protein L2 [uncultured bacterium]|nr:MAG: 50S ribosomal protein L2 [uncultured bacterium]OGH13752.1 MAG: 50S ribosomal protein L2 [Candidatus Levybacteria bacterium RIFCSPHIGHO2_01_FULL_38_26]